jgi:glycosyltransferase involved in cell wall biosynthesis
VDLLYVSHNRKEMTMVSFAELIRNTNWGEIPLHKEHTESITRVFIADDASEDGTCEYLESAAKDIPVEVIFSEGAFRGPVRAMNWYLDLAGSPEGAKFIKIDNDFVVCPGWLEDLALVDGGRCRRRRSRKRHCGRRRRRGRNGRRGCVRRRWRCRACDRRDWRLRGNRRRERGCERQRAGSQKQTLRGDLHRILRCRAAPASFAAAVFWEWKTAPQREVAENYHADPTGSWLPK